MQSCVRPVCAAHAAAGPDPLFELNTFAQHREVRQIGLIAQINPVLPKAILFTGF
jgi:hypothetical protein